MIGGYSGKRIDQGPYYWHCMLAVIKLPEEGGEGLPLSTEPSESVYGKVGCVGDHLG